ncbi:hypothetical protein [Lentibacillus amyloliquefaciens]|uniref:Uncharacterized protein n=1 Tax=Lentibacillus amyloliquefaciens TaxID=1472767 RepID=A0A0U4FIY6_9BACI|nr:hypothetical protein [Lentibacillus amyloliquefaciens]ALX47716.1 hypothetical protein AOX59_03310 [Lentibacillus amyloliquefaciens]
MIAEEKSAYPTYEIMPELKTITSLTYSEQFLNHELETFQPKIQKRMLNAMKTLMADEMAYVLSVENLKRNKPPSE